MTLAELVSAEPVDVEAVARLLDGLTHAQRVAATRLLPRRAVRRLYAAAVGRTPSLDALAPPGAPTLTGTRHLGTNDLITFRAFEKPMFRDRRGRVFGRNDQRWAWLTGPGYFEAKQSGGSVSLDYRALPDEVPDGWPRPRNNRRWFSFFVFRDLEDDLRAVSRHVVVGRASRAGKALPNHFVLVREA
jgi:hypothetical protein